MPASAPDIAAALKRWLAQVAMPDTLPHHRCRYVALDIATSGLSAGDHLLAVAAIGIDQGTIHAHDACAFYLAADAGLRAVQLLALLEFISQAPLVTYQAPFVDAFLTPAIEQSLGVKFVPAWIDLAWVLPELFGGHPGARLDDWLQRFAITLPGRAQAMPDAFAIAQLLQAVQAAASRRGLDTARQLREIEKHRRWLGQSA